MNLLNSNLSANPRKQIRRKDSTGPFGTGPSTGSSTTNTYRIGLGLYTGNYDTSASSAVGSIDKLASHFGGKGSKQFQDVIGQLYSTLTGGYTANYTVSLNAVTSALEAAGKGNITLSDAYVLNGPMSKAGNWTSFTTKPKAPTTPKGKGPGNGGITINQYGGSVGTSDMSASAMMSAYSSVLGTLQNWNLDSLTDQAWQMISDPGFHMNAGEVIDKLRQTKEYQDAFPGMAEIRAKGLSLTEQQYIARESDIMDQFSQNGVPQKMLSKDELGKMVANGIYGSNLNTRIQKGFEAVKNADPRVKELLQKWYGVRPGHLLGYMLSPKHGMNQIVKDVQAAMIGTEAHLDGFKGVDQHTAQQLSKQMTSTGYGMDYFKTGFAKAAGEQPLEQAQIGQRGQATVSQQQILAGTFAGLKEPGVGSQAEAQRAIDLASQARTAGLQSGGGYAQTAKGGLGIGSASSEGTGR